MVREDSPDTKGPLHSHGRYGEFFVLEGSIIDSDRTWIGPGDYVMYEPGSVHFTDTPEGCTVLVTKVDDNDLFD